MPSTPSSARSRLFASPSQSTPTVRNRSDRRSSGTPEQKSRGSNSKQQQQHYDLTDIPSDATSHTMSTTGTGSPQKTSTTENQSTSWWLSMFRKLQEEHEIERKNWQQQTHSSSKQDKQSSSSELKQQINHHLHWLEDRLTAPNHVLPGLSRNSTATTMSSDTSPTTTTTRTQQQQHSNSHQHMMLQYAPALASSSASSMAGVEVTIDSAQQMQRVQHLEQLLEQTKTQHEQDRSEWLQTLEEAAAVTEKGERLSAHQQQQLKKIRTQVESAAQKQKKQYKEKTRVLTELLELTEQQHAAEKNEWKKEQQALEATVSQLIADKSELMEAVEKATADIFNYQQAAAEWKEKVRQRDEEIQIMQQQLKQSKEETLTMQTKLEMYKTELEHARNESEQCKADAALLSAEVERFQSEFAKATSEAQELQKQVEQLKKEAIYFKEQAADCTEHAAANVTKKARKPNLSVAIPPRYPETPSSTASHSSSFTAEMDEKLDRALAERDIFQQEAEMLQKRLAEEKEKHASKVKDMLNRTPSKEELARAESDIMIKYREAVEKHSELVNRLKKIEEHRASDRGYFKLKLEAALAEARKLESEKAALEKTLEELADSHAEEIHNLELQFQRQSVEFFPQSPPMYNSERQRPAPDRESTHPGSCTQHCYEVTRLLESTQAENLELINRCEEFSKNLEELKTLHANASQKYERALADRNQLKEELDTLRQSCNNNEVKKENENSLDPNQPGFVKSFEELRGDVTFMRKALDDLTQSERMNSASFKGVQADLVAIQNSLNDAVAELTLEADSLLESREMIKEVASSTQDSSSKFADQQSRILDELSALRLSVGKALNRRTTPQGSAGGNNNVPWELIEQLQEKEAALATAQAELRHCQEKLEAEIASRQKAEYEISSLQEQADAYEEELMDLQSNNTKLIKQLHAAGLKIDAALLARRMPTWLDDEADDLGDRASGGHATTPMLEDALKLAQGLTDIIHKRENADDEPSAMEMLERMSNMIDVHENTASQRTPRSRSSTSRTPTSRDRHIFDSTGEVEIVHNTDESYAWNELPPSPVETPMPPTNEGKLQVTQLQMVVEQLYGRCELLERERVEMMGVTLDLLESAREANAAELEAALATARRKATEEIMRIRQQNRQEQENIFHRLCNKCIKNGPQLFNASRDV